MQVGTHVLVQVDVRFQSTQQIVVPVLQHVPKLATLFVLAIASIHDQSTWNAVFAEKKPVVRRVKSGRDPLHLKSGFRRAWAYGQCGLNGIPA